MEVLKGGGGDADDVGGSERSLDGDGREMGGGFYMHTGSVRFFML